MVRPLTRAAVWSLAGGWVPGTADSADSMFFLYGLPLTVIAVVLVLRITRKRTV